MIAPEQPEVQEPNEVVDGVIGADAAGADRAETEVLDAPSPEPVPDANVIRIRKPRNKQNGRRKKGIGAFSRGLLIYAGVLAVLFIAGLFVCWEFLSQYEDSQPKYVMDDVCADFTPYLEQGLRAEYGDDISEYEEWNSIFNDVLSPAFDGEYKYKKAVKKYTAENPVFTVYTDSEIADIKLEKTGKTSSFGFDSWRVAGIDITADMSGVSTITATVEAPVGAVITVNGKPLTVTAEEESAVYPLALKYEKGIGTLPEYSVYNIEGLFSVPSVSVKLGDKEMVEHRIGQRHVFGYPEADLHTVSVTVPYDSTVKVGGITLGESEITDGNVKFDTVHKYDNAKYVKYEIQGLLAEPEVEVFDRNGKKREDVRTEGGIHTLSYAESDAYSLTVLCPADGTKLEINGIDATSDLVTDAKTVPEHPMLDGLSGYITGAVRLGYIKLDTTYGVPEVKLTGADGTVYSPVVTNGASGADYVYSPLTDDSLKADLEQYAVAFAEDYIKYASGGYQVVERTFAVAAAHLQAGSPAYKKFESTKFSFGQNKPYTVKSKTITTSEYISWGENCFSCLLDLEMDLETTYNVENPEQHDEVSMRLTFAKSGGKWKIVGLSIV